MRERERERERESERERERKWRREIENDRGERSRKGRRESVCESAILTNLVVTVCIKVVGHLGGLK